MRYVNILLLVSLIFACSVLTPSFSQKKIMPAEFADLTPLSAKDSMELANLPKLTTPSWLKEIGKTELPTIVDNTTNMYWRPVYAQVALECGQASGIGLGFTYEINRLRDLPSDLPENQYATHFTWNFANGGQGYYGVSYFHSFEIVRTLGTPTVNTYGGMTAGGGSRWMSGYNNYVHSMSNRIYEAYQIDVSTEEGIGTAKHWLHNHLENDEFGGVANFYTSAPYGMPTLPSGTPEAGKYVVTSWGGANHGLTISGYHDSISWDYNNDGQYTNDIDLNNDGVITPSDWEIGGFRFANTYSGGPSFGNNGFSYMTYKSAADPYGGGGIWNSAIHVLYAKENCTPQLTAKITLKHSCRNQIRVRVGVSTDQTSETPEYILGLPIFNFQGGCQYMQGGTTNEENKTIEFGLDLTPFLNMVGSNTPARYFLLVDEDDPNNWSPGQIIQYSIIDYTAGVNEIACAQSNVTLNNNSLTKLWVDHTASFDQVEILTDTLPPVTIFEPYSTNLDAIGGTSPYLWDFDLNYTETNFAEAFPMVNAEELNPGTGYTSKTLDFPFPFAGEEFEQIRVYADGYIMLGEELDWPYQVYDFLLFTKNKYIAPFMADLILYSPDNDGLWYEGDAYSATFRWQASVDGFNNTSELNFAVELFKNGDIKLYYGTENEYPPMDWMSGVSAGNNKYYQFTEVSNDLTIPVNYVCDLKSSHYPPGFQIHHSGEFSGLTEEPLNNFEIKFLTLDENNIRDSKVVYFSTDGANYLVIDDYWAWANGDDVIEFGETAVLSFDIKNLGEEPIYGATLQVFSDDEFITLTDSTEALGDFQPDETKTFTGALMFDVSNMVPNDHDIIFNTLILDDFGDDWTSHIYFTAYAPEVYAGGVVIDDGGNGGLDPGETTDVIVTLYNGGGAAVNNLITSLSSDDPFVTINSNSANLESIEANSIGEVVFNITASEDIPSGYIIEFEIDIEADNGYSATTMAYIVVGLITEGFESGGYAAFPWEFSGDGDWVIDNSVYYEGSFSARSGAIGDNQTSSIMLEICVLGDGEISFAKRVSSEAGYDYLKFKIDGTEMGEWDGEQDWTEVIFPITDGVHTLTWSYVKDFSVNNGSDCGWIDFITFPPFGDPNPLMSYNPESFIITTGNQIISDTMTITNEGTGPLFYSITVVDTVGNNVDWLSIDLENGGLNAGDSDNVYLEFDASELDEGNYVAYITITDHMENEYVVPVFMFVDIGTGIHNSKLISEFENIPNPFSNKTSIHFTLEEKASVALEIFNLKGEKIQTLISAVEYSKGAHFVNWNATDDRGASIESGVYFFRISINEEIVTGKMILKN